MRVIGRFGVAWLVAASLSWVAGCGDDGGDGMASDGGPPATCSDGMVSGDETDVDCGGSCDACPLGAACVVPTDCVSSRCTGDTCRAPETCFDFELTEGETDVDCGGPVCPGCLLMDACLEDSDCASANCSEESVCIAECTDGIQNGNESDVDCGGSCGGCAAGGSCAEDEDCASARCEGGSCAASSCDDGARNGDETDVDCGGTVCGPCPGGGACEGNGDCQTLVCTSGMCAATTCTNGIQDGDESDVDCGGATCPGCLPDEACTTAADCGGNPCVGDVCVAATSCLTLAALDGSLGDGTYTIEPTEGEFHRVYCDMTAEGGGWTLVGSSEEDPLNDQASFYYPDLQTLFPEGSNRGVWDGVRELMGNASDIRFACKQRPRSSEFDVDLVFFSNDMYERITAGRDSDTCFFEERPEGDLPIVPPRLVRSGVTVPDAAWTAGDVQRRFEPHGEDGRLVGEDACGDPGDFTVDFDDRGMGGSQSDGTDWGESDTLRKCGTSGLGGGAWFVFVRESNPLCADGIVSGFESDVDCGGACAPCPDGGSCVAPGDCESLICSEEGVCLSPCENGRLDEGETDVDCGGTCPAGCGVRLACTVDADCAVPFVCDGELCLGNHCSNDDVDGDETDVDCGGSCLQCGAGLACDTDLDCAGLPCIGGVCGYCLSDETEFGSSTSYTGCESTPATVTCPDVSVSGTGLSLSDDSSSLVSLPFTFEFFGSDESSVHVGSNGTLTFGSGFTTFTNSCFPGWGSTADLIAPYWDDLDPTRGGTVTYQTLGTEPDREFVVNWDILPIDFLASSAIDVRAVLSEGTNEIRICYVDTDTGSSSSDEGTSATAGIRTGDEHLQYSCNSSVLEEGLELRYVPSE